MDPRTDRRYYFSHALQRTQWERPALADAAPRPAAIPAEVVDDDWQELVDQGTGARFAARCESEWCGW
ncbi:MAG: hypothetical protein ACK41V_23570 [Acidovorax sp.]|uniref:hypothetical protein n=1 Tax=Acidovorax sp. TaxID=1872122 RepID=UPI00391D3DBF